MTHGAPNGGAGGAFSKATFSAEADQVGGGAVDLHDPDFWSKLMPAAAARASGGGLERAARRRSGAHPDLEPDPNPTPTANPKSSPNQVRTG